MKKNLFSLFALVCMALCLSGCGSDEPETTVTASATYQIDFSDDLIDVASVAIVYVADNGQVSIETVNPTTKQWLKRVSYTIKGKEKSTDFGFKVVYTLKGNELTDEPYDLKVDVKITATTPTSNRIFEENLMDANATKANKVAETVSRNSNKAFGVTVTKEGSIERNTGFTVSI